MNEFKLVQFKDPINEIGYITASINKNISRGYKGYCIWLNLKYKIHKITVARAVDNNSFESKLNKLIESEIRCDPIRINFKTFEEIINQYMRRNNIL